MVAGLAWWNKTMHSTMNQTTRDLAEFRQTVAERYVPKDDYKEAMREIREMFHHISSKLDGKADK